MARFFDLSGTDAVLAVAAAAASLAWLVAVAIVFVSRRPPEPPVGPRTLELGAEPPAVANFLANDFRVTDDAVPATLIDLAARNVVDVEQRGPGVFYVRLRPAVSEQLNAYEQRVLDHLRARASNGVVPAEALTTGPGHESTRWRRRFANEVVSDAQRRGLSRDAVAGAVFTVLTVAAAAPALLVWALSEFEAGIVVVGAAVALLGWIRARHPQRETPEGLAAASRWLGVRAELAAHRRALGPPARLRRREPPAADGNRVGYRRLERRRRLVEAGACRVPAPLAARLGARPARGGRRRARGGDRRRALPVLARPVLFDAGVFGALLIVPCAAVLLGISLAVMAYADLRSAVEVTGPILRLRAFGDEKRQRHYVAVDDGESRSIRAWKVNPRHYLGLTQGETVTVATTANLGCVRWIIRDMDALGV